MQTLEGTPALVHAARAESMQGLRTKTLTFGVGFRELKCASTWYTWSFMSMWSYMGDNSPEYGSELWLPYFITPT